MKKKFRLEEYKGRYAMHCNTEEKAKKFLRLLNDNGRKWNDGEQYKEDETLWCYEKEETSYLFNSGLVACREKAKDYGGYKVLEFDDFDWSDYMNPEYKFVITTDGKTTTAKAYIGKTNVAQAQAKLSPTDKFDAVSGAEIAFERLCDKLKKPKLYTGKVICIGKPWQLPYTIGKTYLIKDGVLRCDDGGWMVNGIEDVDDLNQRSLAKWIEAVE